MGIELSASQSLPCCTKLLLLQSLIAGGRVADRLSRVERQMIGVKHREASCVTSSGNVLEER